MSMENTKIFKNNYLALKLQEQRQGGIKEVKKSPNSAVLV